MTSESSRSLQIALAIIFDEAGRVLVARRAGGHLAGLWEFPGGKIAHGESPEQAALRECQEELGVRLRAMGRYPSLDFEYEALSLTFHPILCALEEGQIPQPLAASELKWVQLEELKGWEIPEANHRLIEIIVENEHG